MKKIIVLIVLPLFAFTAIHKFYISVTNIEYSKKDKALQITSRIFVDDIEDLLEERYEIAPKLDTEQELDNVNTYIDRYLSGHLIVKINGEPVNFDFLGKEYDDDIMKCYMEIPGIERQDITSIEVINRTLFDMFPEQQNIVHIKLDDNRKSFILIKGNDKGLLNF